MAAASELTLLANPGDEESSEAPPARSFKLWHIALTVAIVCGIAISAYTLVAPRTDHNKAVTAHAIMRNDDPDSGGSEETTLFESLGGSYPVAAVVDTFIENIMVDPDLNKNPRIEQAHHAIAKAGFKYLVWEVVSNATGGSIVYTGRDMKTAHWHLKITSHQWDAFAGDFGSVLNEYNVPNEMQDKIFKIVGPLKGQVVNEEEGDVESPPPPDADADPDSLYKRLGGIYSIATVADTFINIIMKDEVLNANPKVAAAHHKVLPAGFKALVTQFLGMATGGPQVYSGKSMKEAHKDLGITSAEWNAFALDFKNTLDLYQVPDKEHKELFHALGTLKKDIVTGDDDE